MVRHSRDGTEFELTGHVMSEPHRNQAFTALYDVETHTGTIPLMDMITKRRVRTPRV